MHATAADQARLASLPAIRCPLPGIHYTAAVDGCLHRLNVGCQNTSLIDVDNSCTVPSHTGKYVSPVRWRITSLHLYLLKMTSIFYKDT